MTDACQFMLMTSRQPGAVAILQLWGAGAGDLIQNLLSDVTFALEAGRVRLVALDGIDEGLVARVDEQTWQLMPHGGPRVVQRLADRLVELGAKAVTATQGWDQAGTARAMYPEAASDFEADLLAVLAVSKSPAAIDALTMQHEQWRAMLHESQAVNKQSWPSILEHSSAMDRLIFAPTIVVVGQPNVGKSTLLNALSGRNAAIVADLPGTTRDWVGSRVELLGQVAVHWLDTPGIRSSDDAIEQRAITMARKVIAEADVLIAMRDHEHGWPSLEPDLSSDTARTPDLFVVNKCDRSKTPPQRAPAAEQPVFAISAETGQGLDAMQQAILNKLGLADTTAQPWAFSPTLKAWCAGEAIDLAAYMGTVCV